MFELPQICCQLACQVGDRYRDPGLVNLGSVVLVLMVVVGFLIWKRYHRRKWDRIWHEDDCLEPDHKDRSHRRPPPSP
jgi:hypothetical protein